MFPVNQVILGGGSDPLLGGNTSMSIEEQLRMLERQKQFLEEAQQKQMIASHNNQAVQQKKLIWDEIDNEILPMTDEQKNMLFKNEEYADVYTKLQSLVQAEIINLVKGRIENTPEGRELLNAQLKIVKKLKSKIIDTTNKEMEMFRKFREYSKQHPEVTYEEFIKSMM